MISITVIRDAAVAACLAVAAFFPALSFAGEGEYYKALFAAPSNEEMQKVWDETRYAPACDGFKVGNVFKEFKGGSLRYIQYKSDGYAQTGLFGKPEGKGPFPVAILNHFGFSGITGSEIADAEDFIARGYIVALPTYRGEPGLAGKSEGPVDVLGDEVHDVLNLMECAVKDPDADAEKVVMMGVSHGGGLTLSALGHTSRVKAAATMAAPLNLMGKPIQDMVKTWKKQPSGIEMILQILVSDEGIVKLKKVLGINNPDIKNIHINRRELMRRSPAVFADRITVPVMMWLGDKDPVSFPEDAKTVEASLKSRGIFSRATILANQSHAITPESGAAGKHEIHEFFRRALNGEHIKPE